MSDKLFAPCCSGRETQHAIWEPCSQDLVAGIVAEAQSVLLLHSEMQRRQAAFAAEMATHLNKMNNLATRFAATLANEGEGK